MTYDSANGRERLINCFVNVFPGLSDGEALAATQLNTKAWDSMNSWILLLAIQEEFSVVVGLDQVAKLNDFGKIEAYLRKKVV